MVYVPDLRNEDIKRRLEAMQKTCDRYGMRPRKNYSRGVRQNEENSRGAESQLGPADHVSPGDPAKNRLTG